MVGNAFIYSKKKEIKKQKENSELNQNNLDISISEEEAEEEKETKGSTNEVADYQTTEIVDEP